MPLGTLGKKEREEAERDGRDHGGDHEVPPVGEDVGEEGEGEPARDPGPLAPDPDDGLPLAAHDLHGPHEGVGEHSDGEAALDVDGVGMSNQVDSSQVKSTIFD